MNIKSFEIIFFYLANEFEFFLKVVTPPPPPPSKPIAPASTVPVAAIRHAQASEAAVKVSFLYATIKH